MNEYEIIFRGTRVLPDWPQRVTTCRLNGIEMGRVRYGEEMEDWGAGERPCHDCVAIPGEFHVPGCDVERCLACEGQLLSCACVSPDDAERGASNPRPGVVVAGLCEAGALRFRGHRPRLQCEVSNHRGHRPRLE
jgi:hypothetical protein